VPGHARKDIVSKGEIGVYHTWSRCVQRAYLCGHDPLTGIDFDYRRTWIQSLLEYQASVFAVDVGNYSILSNHQHAILRTRPDIAATWSDEEVAWRWKLAWPSFMDGQWVREPTDEEIEEILSQPHRLPILRGNLADLSWFMARWKEPIARMANAESRTKGHYYEQRFGSRKLEDEPGVICCNVYLDLNQLKAGMVHSLDKARCSAIHDRIHAWRKREAENSVTQFREDAEQDQAILVADVENLLNDCFLSPINAAGPLLLIRDVTTSITSMTSIVNPVVVGEETSQTNLDLAPGEAAENGSDAQPSRDVDPTPTPAIGDKTEPAHGRDTTAKKRKIHQRLQARRRRRASDHVLVDMPWRQYLRIVELTASQFTPEAARPPPAELDSLLRSARIEPSQWLAVIEHFGDWFHVAVGHVDHLTVLNRSERQWIQGITACRDVFT
jgi:hypothetical protein